MIRERNARPRRVPRVHGPQYPLHDPGKVLALSRLNDQMEMVPHDGEVLDSKGISALRFDDPIEK
jgi:hypothetical protein